MKKSKIKTEGIPNKYQKYLNSAWTDDFDAMSADELKAAIVASENSIVEQEKLIAEDQHLKEAKLVVADLSAGYKEAIGYQKTKTKYALLRLEQLGQV